jgi:hypothetical protein
VGSERSGRKERKKGDNDVKKLHDVRELESGERGKKKVGGNGKTHGYTNSTDTPRNAQQTYTRLE